MKKILLLGAFMLLITGRVSAQSAIILTENNVPVFPGPFHYSVVNPKLFTVPKSGINIKWDYSNIKGDTSIKQLFLSHYNTPFTNSTTAIADTGKREFLTSNSNFVKVDYYDKDVKGFFFAGDYVKSQYFSLASYFNNPSDNITIPQQNDSVRLNIIHFPMTSGSCDRYKTTKSLHFSWTVNSAGLTDAPSIKKTFYNVEDTVTAWGTLRVPDSVTRSIAYPVLLVRHKEITIDSYYVNNTAANKFFLIAFGITQGKKTVDCDEYFYRAGHQNPLFTIEFGGDTTFTTPIDALYTTDSIKKQVGVEILNERDNHSFSVYPNPANGSQVNCSFTKEVNQQWKILIFNSIGQVFKSETVEGNGKINMSLDITGAKAGLYFVNVLDEMGQVVASSKLNIVR
jgi:hypothetical protein